MAENIFKIRLLQVGKINTESWRKKKGEKNTKK